MNPEALEVIDLLDRAGAEGVVIAADQAGLRLRGSREAVARWAPAVRERKGEILRVIQERALADALAAAAAELGWGAEDTRGFLRDDLPEIGVAAAIEVIKDLLAHERALRSQARAGAPFIREGAR